MSFSEETLMAYADGELAQAEREQLERAMQGDPELAARVARHQALRADVFAAFAPVLDEPMPARLAAAVLPDKAPDVAADKVAHLAADLVADKMADKVADLAAVRAARGERDAATAPAAANSIAASAQSRPPRRAWSWAEWGGMAASLAVGVLAGSVLLGGQQPSSVANVAGGGALAASGGGVLVATGALADALSSQLASNTSGSASNHEPANGSNSASSNAPVQIGVSFAAKDGTLCRSFITGKAAGLACRSGGQWTLPLVVEAEPGTPGEYRQAGSTMPAAVLDAIDARIAGQALDADGERAAQQAGWVRKDVAK